MTVVVTHTTPADGTFSATGAAAWDANHALSGIGTMAEQNANNVAITGGTISGVTLPAGGSTTQVQYNNAGAFAGDSGLTYDATNKALTVGGGTITASTPALNITQTWNNAAVAFTGLKFNVTDTASAASGALLMDLQVGGSTKFNVAKSGLVTAPGLVISGTFGSATGNWWSSSTINVPSASTISFNLDTILGRRGAANLRLGATDATSATPQTLSVQSVIAGTSNVAGANLTIAGSQGTGTGAGGSIIFQTAAAGTTGTAQNALAAALTLASDKSATFAGQILTSTGTGAASSIQSATNLSIRTAGNASILFYGTDVNNDYFSLSISGTPNFACKNTAQFGWTNAAYSATTLDTILTRRGPANLRLGAADAASATPQTLSVQSVVAGTSNTAGAAFTITGSQGTGTGAGGSIIFQVAPAGTTGTAQNALVNAMVIDSVKTIRIGTGYTVATLPAAGTAGRYTYVTDATLPTYLGALIGGGSVVCPVFDNGTAWVSA